MSEIAARRYRPVHGLIGRRVAVDWIDGHPIWRQGVMASQAFDAGMHLRTRRREVHSMLVLRDE